MDFQMIISISIIIIYALWECIKVFLLHRSLVQPIKPFIKKINRKPSLFDPTNQKLKEYYYSYSQLPTYALNTIDMFTQIKEADKNLISSVADLMAKLFFSLSTFFIGSLLTMTNNLPKNSDKDWESMLRIYSDIMSSSTFIILSAFIVFSITAFDIFSSTLSNKYIVKIHQLAINQAKKDREKNIGRIMLGKNICLQTSADFDNAMYFGLNISVWQNGEIINYGGKIERHTDEAVIINGGYYLKADYEFRVR